VEWTLTPESSNISRIGYESNEMRLRVEFRNEATYDYFDIPHQLFEDLKSASSKGQFLSSNIKGNFRYARV